MIHPLSDLPLSSRHRVSQIQFHPSLPYLAVQSHDRSVEIFRVRGEEEVRKKQARREKRMREKQEKEPKQGKEKVAGSHQGQENAEENGLALVDLFTPYLVVRASGKIRSFDFGPDDAKGNVQVGEFLFNWILLIPLDFHRIINQRS